jgi:hypothetical protein
VEEPGYQPETLTPEAWAAAVRDARIAMEELGSALDRLRGVFLQLESAQPAPVFAATAPQTPAEAATEPALAVEAAAIVEETVAETASQTPAEAATEPAMAAETEEIEVAKEETPAALPEDPETPREAVRLAVAQTRADLASGRVSREELFGADEPSRTRQEPGERGEPEALPPLREEEAVSLERDARPVARLTPAPARGDESGAQGGSTVLTVEDTSGRVELARVYDALNRLGWAAGSSLVGYAPHGVSVSLGAVVRFSEETLIEAIEYTFGRSCEVTVDGAHVSVRLLAAKAEAA